MASELAKLRTTRMVYALLGATLALTVVSVAASILTAGGRRHLQPGHPRRGAQVESTTGDVFSAALGSSEPHTHSQGGTMPDWPVVPGPETDFDIQPIQYLLNERGAGLAPDGIFGPITDGRVRDFQLTFGATVDGIVGPETWLLLVSPKSE